MPRDDIDWAVLDRYLTGECNAAERAAVEAWASAEPEHRAELDALRAGLHGSPVVEGDTEGQIRSILRAATGPSFTTQRGPAAPRWRPVAVAAALVVLAAGVSVVVSGRAALRAYREYATVPGQSETVTLADGTRIVLAPASRVRVPTENRRGRPVVLDGEALFTVTHDPTHPFAVRAGNALVTDIGTQFNVRAYRTDDHHVRVAVVEGRVGVATVGVGAAFRPPVASRAQELSATVVAVVTDTVVAITHGADITVMTGWTQGRLVFDNVPAHEVMAELERWYDLDISGMDSSQAAMRVTAVYNHEPVDAVLTAVTAVLGAHYERHGRSVRITRDHT